MKHIKKLAIVMTFVMLFSIVLTMNVFAEGHEPANESKEYYVTGEIKDNTETEVDESVVLKDLIALYGDHKSTLFSLSETENCKNKMSVSVEDRHFTVWVSEILVPNGSKSVMAKNGTIYFYYDEPQGIYSNKCTFTSNGETITGYFYKKVSPILFGDKPTDNTNNTNTDTNINTEIEQKSLQDVIDCLIELESDITILMIGLIVVSVFACASLCFCIITRYKYLVLRDTVQELIEKKKPNNVSHNAHSKKKKNKR